MNELVQVFNGVRGYEQDGVAYLHIEDVVRGLGFVQVAVQNGKEYTKARWSRVEGLLNDLGFAPQVEQSGNPHDYYIPENIFYRLCMKARNETAEAFQAKVADDIIPSIRRTGRYEVKQAIPDFSNPAEAARAWADAYEVKQKALEEQQKALTALGEKELELSDERQKHKHDRCHDNGKCGGITKNRNHYKNKSERLQTENTELQTENNELQDAVGRGKNWMTISVMKSEWISKYDHKPDWKKLKEFSKEVGIAPIKDVDETVKHDNGVLMPIKVFRYHKDAWERYRKYEELLK
jgi:prophage antirepressor-like protein